MNLVKKNKRGGVFLGVIFFFIIFISGMMFIEPITDTIDESRVDLDCSSPDSISDGNKVLCLVVDATLPYFIVLIASLALSFVGWRLI